MKNKVFIREVSEKNVGVVKKKKLTADAFLLVFICFLTLMAMVGFTFLTEGSKILTGDKAIAAQDENEQQHIITTEWIGQTDSMASFSENGEETETSFDGDNVKIAEAIAYGVNYYVDSEGYTVIDYLKHDEKGNIVYAEDGIPYAERYREDCGNSAEAEVTVDLDKALGLEGVTSQKEMIEKALETKTAYAKSEETVDEGWTVIAVNSVKSTPALSASSSKSAYQSGCSTTCYCQVTFSGGSWNNWATKKQLACSASYSISADGSSDNSKPRSLTGNAGWFGGASPVNQNSGSSTTKYYLQGGSESSSAPSTYLTSNGLTTFFVSAYGAANGYEDCEDTDLNLSINNCIISYKHINGNGLSLSKNVVSKTTWANYRSSQEIALTCESKTDYIRYMGYRYDNSVSTGEQWKYVYSSSAGSYSSDTSTSGGKTYTDPSVTLKNDGNCYGVVQYRASDYGDHSIVWTTVYNAVSLKVDNKKPNLTIKGLYKTKGVTDAGALQTASSTSLADNQFKKISLKDNPTLFFIVETSDSADTYNGASGISGVTAAGGKVFTYLTGNYWYYEVKTEEANGNWTITSSDSVTTGSKNTTTVSFFVSCVDCSVPIEDKLVVDYAQTESRAGTRWTVTDTAESSRWSSAPLYCYVDFSDSTGETTVSGYKKCSSIKTATLSFYFNNKSYSYSATSSTPNGAIGLFISDTSMTGTATKDLKTARVSFYMPFDSRYTYTDSSKTKAGFTLTVTDHVGHENQNKNFEIKDTRIDTAAPVISSVKISDGASSDYTNKSSLKITVTASDAQKDSTINNYSGLYAIYVYALDPTNTMYASAPVWEAKELTTCSTGDNKTSKIVEFNVTDGRASGVLDTYSLQNAGNNSEKTLPLIYVVAEDWAGNRTDSYNGYNCRSDYSKNTDQDNDKTDYSINGISVKTAFGVDYYRSPNTLVTEKLYYDYYKPIISVYTEKNDSAVPIASGDGTSSLYYAYPYDKTQASITFYVALTVGCSGGSLTVKGGHVNESDKTSGSFGTGTTLVEKVVGDYTSNGMIYQNDSMNSYAQEYSTSWTKVEIKDQGKYRVNISFASESGTSAQTISIVTRIDTTAPKIEFKGFSRNTNYENPESLTFEDIGKSTESTAWYKMSCYAVFKVTDGESGVIPEDKMGFGSDEKDGSADTNLRYELVFSYQNQSKRKYTFTKQVTDFSKQVTFTYVNGALYIMEKVFDKGDYQELIANDGVTPFYNSETGTYDISESTYLMYSLTICDFAGNSSTTNLDAYKVDPFSLRGSVTMYTIKANTSNYMGPTFGELNNVNTPKYLGDWTNNDIIAEVTVIPSLSGGGVPKVGYNKNLPQNTLDYTVDDGGLEYEVKTVETNKRYRFLFSKEKTKNTFICFKLGTEGYTLNTRPAEEDLGEQTDSYLVVKQDNVAPNLLGLVISSSPTVTGLNDSNILLYFDVTKVASGKDNFEYLYTLNETYSHQYDYSSAKANKFNAKVGSVGYDYYYTCFDKGVYLYIIVTDTMDGFSGSGICNENLQELRLDESVTKNYEKVSLKMGTSTGHAKPVAHLGDGKYLYMCTTSEGAFTNEFGNKDETLNMNPSTYILTVKDAIGNETVVSIGGREGRIKNQSTKRYVIMPYIDDISPYIRLVGTNNVGQIGQGRENEPDSSYTIEYTNDNGDKIKDSETNTILKLAGTKTIYSKQSTLSIYLSGSVGTSGYSIYLRERPINEDLGSSPNYAYLEKYVSGQLLPSDYDFAKEGWGKYNDYQVAGNTKWVCSSEPLISSTGNLDSEATKTITISSNSINNRFDVLIVSGVGKYYLIEMGDIRIDLEAPVYNPDMTFFVLSGDEEEFEWEYNEVSKETVDNIVSGGRWNAEYEQYAYKKEGKYVSEPEYNKNATYYKKENPSVSYTTIAQVEGASPEEIDEMKPIWREVYKNYMYYDDGTLRQATSTFVEDSNYYYRYANLIWSTVVEDSYVNGNVNIYYSIEDSASGVDDSTVCFVNSNNNTSVTLLKIKVTDVPVYAINGATTRIRYIGSQVSKYTIKQTASASGYFVVQETLIDGTKKEYETDILFSSNPSISVATSEFYYYRFRWTKNITTNIKLDSIKDLSENVMGEGSERPQIFSLNIDQKSVSVSIFQENGQTGFNPAEFTNQDIKTTISVTVGESGFGSLIMSKYDLTKENGEYSVDEKSIIYIPTIITFGAQTRIKYYAENGNLTTTLVAVNTSDTTRETMMEIKRESDRYRLYLNDTATSIYVKYAFYKAIIDKQMTITVLPQITENIITTTTIKFIFTTSENSNIKYHIVARNAIFSKVEAGKEDSQSATGVFPAKTTDSQYVNIKLDFDAPTIEFSDDFKAIIFDYYCSTCKKYLVRKSNDNYQTGDIFVDEDGKCSLCKNYVTENWYSIPKLLALNISDSLSGIGKTAPDSYSSVDNIRLSYEGGPTIYLYNDFSMGGLPKDGLYRPMSLKKDKGKMVRDVLVLCSERKEYILTVTDSAGNTTTIKFTPKIETIDAYMQEEGSDKNLSIHYVDMTTGTVLGEYNNSNNQTNWSNRGLVICTDIYYGGSGFVIQKEESTTSSFEGKWEEPMKAYYSWSDVKNVSNGYLVLNESYSDGIFHAKILIPIACSSNTKAYYNYVALRVLSNATYIVLKNKNKNEINLTETGYEYWFSSDKTCTELKYYSFSAQKVEGQQYNYLINSQTMSKNLRGVEKTGLIAVDKVVPQVSATVMSDDALYGSGEGNTWLCNEENSIKYVNGSIIITLSVSYKAEDDLSAINLEFASGNMIYLTSDINAEKSQYEKWVRISKDGTQYTYNTQSEKWEIRTSDINIQVKSGLVQKLTKSEYVKTLTYKLDDSQYNTAYKFYAQSGAGVDSEVYSVERLYSDTATPSLEVVAMSSYQEFVIGANGYIEVTQNEYKDASYDVANYIYDTQKATFTCKNSIIVQVRVSLGSGENFFGGYSGIRLWINGSNVKTITYETLKNNKGSSIYYFAFSGAQQTDVTIKAEEVAENNNTGAHKNASKNMKLKIDNTVPFMTIESISTDGKASNWYVANDSDRWYTDEIKFVLNVSSLRKIGGEYVYQDSAPLSGYKVYYKMTYYESLEGDEKVIEQQITQKENGKYCLMISNSEVLYSATLEFTVRSQSVYSNTDITINEALSYTISSSKAQNIYDNRVETYQDGNATKVRPIRNENEQEIGKIDKVRYKTALLSATELHVALGGITGLTSAGQLGNRYTVNENGMLEFIKDGGKFYVDFNTQKIIAVRKNNIIYSLDNYGRIIYKEYSIAKGDQTDGLIYFSDIGSSSAYVYISDRPVEVSVYSDYYMSKTSMEFGNPENSYYIDARVHAYSYGCIDGVWGIYEKEYYYDYLEEVPYIKTTDNVIVDSDNEVSVAQGDFVYRFNYDSNDYNYIYIAQLFVGTGKIDDDTDKFVTRTVYVGDYKSDAVTVSESGGTFVAVDESQLNKFKHGDIIKIVYTTKNNSTYHYFHDYTTISVAERDSNDDTKYNAVSEIEIWAKNTRDDEKSGSFTAVFEAGHLLFVADFGAELEVEYDKAVFYLQLNDKGKNVTTGTVTYEYGTGDKKVSVSPELTYVYKDYNSNIVSAKNNRLEDSKVGAYYVEPGLPSLDKEKGIGNFRVYAKDGSGGVEKKYFVIKYFNEDLVKFNTVSGTFEYAEEGVQIAFYKKYYQIEETARANIIARGIKEGSSDYEIEFNKVVQSLLTNSPYYKEAQKKVDYQEFLREKGIGNFFIFSETDLSYMAKAYYDLGADGKIVSYSYLKDTNNNNFVLANDLVLSASFAGLKGIFEGTLNGNQKTLTYSNSTVTANFGLFEEMSGIVYDLKIKCQNKITVTNGVQNAYFGLLAQRFNGGVIVNVSCEGDIVLNKLGTGRSYFGGIAGTAVGGELGGSCDVETWQYSDPGQGAVYGNVKTTAMGYVYTDIRVSNEGNFIRNSYVGGMFGFVNNTKFTNAIAYGDIVVYNVEDTLAGIVSAGGSYGMVGELIYFNNNTFVNDEVVSGASQGLSVGVSKTYADFVSSDNLSLGVKVVVDETIRQKILKRLYSDFGYTINNDTYTYGTGANVKNALQIDTLKRFRMIDSYVNLYYVLTADITFNAYTTPVALHKVFNGYIDGSTNNQYDSTKKEYNSPYHSIIGLGSGMNDITCAKYGLFGQLNGTVSHIIFLDTQLSVTYSGDDDFYIGLVAGKSYANAVVTDVICHVGKMEIVSETESNICVGGVIGSTVESTIRNVFSLVTLTTKANFTTLGGIVGQSDDTTIGKQSDASANNGYVFSLGRVDARRMNDEKDSNIVAGAIVGAGDAKTKANEGTRVYFIEHNTYNVGLYVGENYIAEGNWTEGSSPESKDFANEDLRNKKGFDYINANIFDFIYGDVDTQNSYGDIQTNHWYPLEGKGNSQSDPFIVETIDDVYSIDYALYGYYRIANDINFAVDGISLFKTIGLGLDFTGTIDGSGSSNDDASAETNSLVALENISGPFIYNISDTGVLQNIGLNIKYEATISNEETLYFGAVAIYCSGNIKNVTVGGTVTIIGVNSSTTVYASGYVAISKGGNIAIGEINSRLRNAISAVEINIVNVGTVFAGGYAAVIEGGQPEFSYGIANMDKSKIIITNGVNTTVGHLAGQVFGEVDWTLNLPDKYFYEIIFRTIKNGVITETEYSIRDGDGNIRVFGKKE